jgi:hypothetical protein
MTNYMQLQPTVDVADVETDAYLPDPLPACEK